jgi:hypothetical protein
MKKFTFVCTVYQGPFFTVQTVSETIKENVNLEDNPKIWYLPIVRQLCACLRPTSLCDLEFARSHSYPPPLPSKYS